MPSSALAQPSDHVVAAVVTGAERSAQTLVSCHKKDAGLDSIPCAFKAGREVRITSPCGAGDATTGTSAASRRGSCKQWAGVRHKHSWAPGAPASEAKLFKTKCSPSRQESRCFSGVRQVSCFTAIGSKLVEYVAMMVSSRHASVYAGTEALSSAIPLLIEPDIACSVSDTMTAIATAALLGFPGGKRALAKKMARLAFAPAQRILTNSAHKLFLTRRQEVRLQELHNAAQGGHVEAAHAILRPRHGTLSLSRSRRGGRRWQSFPSAMVPWILFVPAMFDCDVLRGMVGWMLFCHVCLGVILAMGFKLSGSFENN